MSAKRLTEKQQNIISHEYANDLNKKLVDEGSIKQLIRDEIRSFMNTQYTISLAKVIQVYDSELLIELLYHPFLYSMDNIQFRINKAQNRTSAFSLEAGDKIFIAQLSSDLDKMIKEEKIYEDKRVLSNAVIIDKFISQQDIDGLNISHDGTSNINIKNGEIRIKASSIVFLNDDGNEIGKLSFSDWTILNKSFLNHTHQAGEYLAPSGGGPVTGISGVVV